MTGVITFIDGYPIDAAVSEQHQFESDVSEFPVEKGSNIVDNVRNKPIRITLECIVSNAPIGNIASERNGTEDPADEAYAKMLKIRDAREPITIATSLDTWDNMVLESLSIPRTTGQGDYLRFTATFVQVEIVSNTRSTRVAIPIAKRPKNVGGAPKPAAPPSPSDSAPLTKIIKIRQDYAYSGGGPVSWIWYDQDIGGWRDQVFMNIGTEGDVASLVVTPGSPVLGGLIGGLVPSALTPAFKLYSVTKGRIFGSSLDAWNANRADSYWAPIIKQAFANSDGTNNDYNPYEATGVSVLDEKVVHATRK